MDNKKRVRRGESFGRVGLDRTISSSLKSPTRQKHKRRNQHEQQQQAKKVQQQPQEQREDNSTTDATQQQLQQQKPMVVHFNPETPREFICSHYDEDMTPEQKEERRKELWYQVCYNSTFFHERGRSSSHLQVSPEEVLHDDISLTHSFIHSFILRCTTLHVFTLLLPFANTLIETRV